MWRCEGEKRRNVALRKGKEKKCGDEKGKKEIWRCEGEKRRNVALRRGKEKKCGAANGKGRKCGNVEKSKLVTRMNFFSNKERNE